MAIQSIEILKAWFKTGKKPTEAQFNDWLDSYIHKSTGIAITDVADLVATLNGKASLNHNHIETLIDWTDEMFDKPTGVTNEALESDKLISSDANYIYIRCADNKWVRSKIHKESDETFDWS